MDEGLPGVEIFTDGACSGNPGSGGYGVILKYGKHKRELSGGFSRTTNNRMELMAVLKGLEALKRPCRVHLYTDSQYIVNAMTKGWVNRWRENGWKRDKKNAAKNSDLWEKILQYSGKHEITWNWVRGHSDNEYNNRCDRLAVEASQKHGLPCDNGYVEEN